MSMVQMVTFVPWQGIPPRAACTSQVQSATPCHTMVPSGSWVVGESQSATQSEVLLQFQRPSTKKNRIGKENLWKSSSKGVAEAQL